MPETSPYAQADRTIARLNRYAIRKFEQCKRTIANFDELNVINRVTTLYRVLDAETRKELFNLFVVRYLEVMASIGKDEPDEDTVDDLAELHITGILGEPDPVTKYTYDAEILRKRDRAIESIKAVSGKIEKREELDKALRFFSQMMGQYADNVSEDANIQALKDAGVKRVVWHTQEDEKVCSECSPLDGKSFDIEKIPDKPHWRCRCYITPAE